MRDQTDYAWAAGFFDGEGSTCVNGDYATIQLSLIQKNPVPILKFADIFGMREQVYGPNVRGVYQFNVPTKKAITILGLMWPYLAQPKKDQAIAVLDELTERLGGRELGKQGRPKKMV